MNKIIKHTVAHLICLFMLVGVIGIPVIFSHTHNPEYSIEQLEEETPVCESATLCCSTEEKPQESLTKNNCNCSLLASCCCCFSDVRLVSFVFDTPVHEPVSIPSFVQAFVRDIGIKKLLSYCSHISWYYFDLPPPKTYSQQLAIFQVFRIWFFINPNLNQGNGLVIMSKIKLWNI